MATIRIIKGRIYYQFTFKGVKCTEKAGLEATPENVKRTRKFAKLIDAEIENGIFQYEKYFPHGAKIEVFAPKREDLLFNRYFADWLAGKVLKETTRRNWESAFWKHLYPFFKDRLLSTITRADVRLFQRTMVDKGLEPSTINDKAMKVLSMMLHQAYVDEIIPKNPTLGVMRLAQGLTDVDPFTIEEREEIIGGFQRYAPHYLNYVICGFWTGWRPNEACALKWHRVDFNQGKILIREGRVLGLTGIPKGRGQSPGHRPAASGARGLDRPKGFELAVGRICFSGRQAEAGEPGDLPAEGLGTRPKTFEPALPAALPDAPYLCHPGDLGRGEHQLGSPHVGAQKPRGDLGEV
ncbi:MAG: DUF3596 domain-containing protein [Syntrophobacterales bacterium]|jgi:integrase|nr:DUF3596 domain-containing protein [Syntrophobacterales bacterium]